MQCTPKAAHKSSRCSLHSACSRYLLSPGPAPDQGETPTLRVLVGPDGWRKGPRSLAPGTAASPQNAPQGQGCPGESLRPRTPGRGIRGQLSSSCALPALWSWRPTHSNSYNFSDTRSTSELHVFFKDAWWWNPVTVLWEAWTSLSGETLWASTRDRN